MDYVGLLLIFCARIVDVSCGTVRILFLVRGRRALAAMIGFVEVMIYLTALLVVNQKKVKNKPDGIRNDDRIKPKTHNYER